MRWEGGRQSDNIEDQRNEPDSGDPVFRTGFSGIGLGLLSRGGLRGLFILVAIFIGLSFFGFNPSRFLFGDGALVRENAAPQSQQHHSLDTDDRRGRFIATVLAETEDTWTEIFNRHHAQYRPPILVRFSGTTHSACGVATAAVGPFYCPVDQKLYLDDRFFDELSNQFGAPGEFAQAYVIAHEVGHHIQNLTGKLDANSNQQAHLGHSAANALSVKTELQADCYAGVWAYSTEQKGLLDSGDIDSALNAAAKIGDDTLQKQTQGYVVPDSFTHGTSAQRVSAFKQGYQSGQMEACDAL